MHRLNTENIARGCFRIASHAPVGLETLPKTFAESPYAAFAGRATVSAAPACGRRGKEGVRVSLSFVRDASNRGVVSSRRSLFSSLRVGFDGRIDRSAIPTRGEPHLKFKRRSRDARRRGRPRRRRHVAEKFSRRDATPRRGRHRRDAPRRARDRPTERARDPRVSGGA